MNNEGYHLVSRNMYLKGFSTCVRLWRGRTQVIRKPKNKACGKGLAGQGWETMGDLIWGTSHSFIGGEMVELRPGE